MSWAAGEEGLLRDSAMYSVIAPEWDAVRLIAWLVRHSPGAVPPGARPARAASHRAGPWFDADHPRLARALGYRDSVRAWRADGGILTIGRGIAGRWQVFIEMDPDRRGARLGRALAAAVRHLLPGGI